MYADDVVSPADTVIQLQRQINSVENFCQVSDMKINSKKTQIAVFRNGGRTRNAEKWKLDNKDISVVSFYQYMGLLFTPKLKWTKALSVLAAQATKSISAFRSFSQRFGSLNHYEFFKIFDTMVKPILLYGGEVWGYTYRESVERINILACKQFLGVGKYTNNYMALGECGRYPLCLDYFVKFLKYWCKIIQMPEHRYPKQCYLMLKNLDDIDKHRYATNVRNLLFSYGFGFVWISQDVGNIDLFISHVKLRLKDILQQEWHGQLNISSKGQKYLQYKSLLNVECYISYNFSFYLRKAFAKFRCSNHRLNIEFGRHNNIVKEERICTFCYERSSIEVIDDEFHVFF